jgi:alpha-methylacyl-CoA racemase
MSTGGPLAGIRILELAGIGPGPFAAMLLADLGADVLRIDRADRARGAPDPIPGRADAEHDLLNRGRKSVAIDLKHADGRAAVLRLVESADALIEGFRPGVVERLGIGPDECRRRNPRLVYGRMTGWGQEGPLAQAVGHDINYIAVGGALGAIGRAGQPPTPPLSLVGDFGGGGMLLALGVVSALLEARRSGQGQVVDAAMVDGTALLMTHFYGLSSVGIWRDERGTNRIDSGAHFYDVYETKDGEYVAVGAIEPRFYANLLAALQLDQVELPDQMDRDTWPAMKERFATVFRTRTRDEWCRAVDGLETCISPVLSLAEATRHEHNAARGTFVEAAGVVQPAPAPRFSRTPGAIRRPPPRPGQHTRDGLAEWGFAPDEIDALVAADAVAHAG